jgi:hypothetical protein
MENVFKNDNKIMISKGELNAINFAWYFIHVYVCPKQHTFPSHENILYKHHFVQKKNHG